MNLRQSGLVLVATLTGVGFSSATWAGGFTNGGFEANPPLTGWTVDGSAQVVNATFGKTPPEGVQQAYLDNDTTNGALDVATLESDLGLAPGTLSGGSFDAVNGSAISQTITAQAGEGVTFTWDFLTAQDPNFSPTNDFSFAVIRNTGTSAASITVLGDYLTAVIGLPYNGSLPTPSTDDFLTETGYEQTSLTFAGAGTYDVSFGVAHRDSDGVASALLVDNVIVTPEPSFVALFAPLAGSLLVGLWRRRMRSQA